MPAPSKPSLGLVFEVTYIWLAALAVLVLAFELRPRLSIFELDPKNDFVTKVIDVASVFTAYALTVITVLPALDDRTAVQRLRKFGQYNIFTSYVATALYANAWLIVFGLILKLGFDRFGTHRQHLAPVLSAVWWSSCTLSLFALTRASRLLIKLVRSS